VERRSVLLLLRLIGYELQAPVASTAVLRLTFNAPAAGQPTTVTIPQGAQFATKGAQSPAQMFEYLGPDLTVDLASDRVTVGADGKSVYDALPVRHSRLAPTAVLGSATGEPNQAFALAQSPAILDTLSVEVDEGAGFVGWNRRDNLLYHIAGDGSVTLSGPNDPDYYVQVDENGVAWVVFGDGVYGRRPTPGAANVRATYRVGGGAVGNVGSNAIIDKKTAIPGLNAVANPLPAVGGADGESIEHAVSFGPLSFRSSGRAVTLNDYVALAQQAGGVAKVRAQTSGFNRVDLYVAPEGQGAGPAPDDLKRRLVAFFADKRMVGTEVFIRDPTLVPIDIAASVIVAHNHDPTAVQIQSSNAIAQLVAFANVDFGQDLFLSKVYEALEALDGVFATTVTRFRRQQTRVVPILRRRVFGIEVDLGLSDVQLRSLAGEIPADGRIDIAPTELATPGAITVTIEDAPR
jgi:predicted phage baseplate assembly protein